MCDKIKVASKAYVDRVADGIIRDVSSNLSEYMNMSSTATTGALVASDDVEYNNSVSMGAKFINDTYIRRDDMGEYRKMDNLEYVIGSWVEDDEFKHGYVNSKETYYYKHMSVNVYDRVKLIYEENGREYVIIGEKKEAGPILYECDGFEISLESGDIILRTKDGVDRTLKKLFVNTSEIVTTRLATEEYVNSARISNMSDYYSKGEVDSIVGGMMTADNVSDMISSSLTEDGLDKYVRVDDDRYVKRSDYVKILDGVCMEKVDGYANEHILQNPPGNSSYTLILRINLYNGSSYKHVICVKDGAVVESTMDKMNDQFDPAEFALHINELSAYRNRISSVCVDDMYVGELDKYYTRGYVDDMLGECSKLDDLERLYVKKGVRYVDVELDGKEYVNSGDSACYYIQHPPKLASYRIAIRVKVDTGELMHTYSVINGTIISTECELEDPVIMFNPATFDIHKVVEYGSIDRAVVTELQEIVLFGLEEYYTRAEIDNMSTESTVLVSSDEAEFNHSAGMTAKYINDTFARRGEMGEYRRMDDVAVSVVADDGRVENSTLVSEYECSRAYVSKAPRAAKVGIGLSSDAGNINSASSSTEYYTLDYGIGVGDTCHIIFSDVNTELWEDNNYTFVDASEVIPSIPAGTAVACSIADRYEGVDWAVVYVPGNMTIMLNSTSGRVREFRIAEMHKYAETSDFAAGVHGMIDGRVVKASDGAAVGSDAMVYSARMVNKLIDDAVGRAGPRQYFSADFVDNSCRTASIAGRFIMYSIRLGDSARYVYQGLSFGEDVSDAGEVVVEDGLSFKYTYSSDGVLTIASEASVDVEYFIIF